LSLQAHKGHKTSLKRIGIKKLLRFPPSDNQKTELYFFDLKIKAFNKILYGNSFMISIESNNKKPYSSDNQSKSKNLF